MAQWPPGGGAPRKQPSARMLKASGKELGCAWTMRKRESHFSRLESSSETNGRQLKAGNTHLFFLGDEVTAQ